MAEGWVQNGRVRLHYLDCKPRGVESRLPIVFVPGMLGSAEDYSSEIASLSKRRCIAVSLRGRGRSSAPRRGYSFEDHVTDIDAITRKLRLAAFCLMGYSTGAAFALGYAVRHPQAVRGLIIGDYPAQYPAFGRQWANRVLSQTHRPIKPHVVHALQRESAELELWGQLSQIECPVLILRGGRPESLLTSEAAGRYQKSLRRARMVVFHDSGHDLSKPDYERYIDTIESFVEEIELSDAQA